MKLDEKDRSLACLVSSLIQVGGMNSQQVWYVLLKIPTRLLEWFLLCSDELNSDDMKGMSLHVIQIHGKEVVASIKRGILVRLDNSNY